MSLDGWVRENKHVLQLIHDDAKREGTTTEKAAAAAAQSGEEDDASAKHKALIGEPTRRLPTAQLLRARLDCAHGIYTPGQSYQPMPA